MGKLHIGEISELSNKVCRLDEQVQTLQEQANNNNTSISTHEERLNQIDTTLEEQGESIGTLQEQVETLEGEMFVLVTEDQFDALTPEQKAEKNYAVIEE